MAFVAVPSIGLSNILLLLHVLTLKVVATAVVEGTIVVVVVLVVQQYFWNIRYF
jgi:hypothetical protein